MPTSFTSEQAVHSETPGPLTSIVTSKGSSPYPTSLRNTEASSIDRESSTPAYVTSSVLSNTVTTMPASDITSTKISSTEVTNSNENHSDIIQSTMGAFSPSSELQTSSVTQVHLSASSNPSISSSKVSTIMSSSFSLESISTSHQTRGTVSTSGQFAPTLHSTLFPVTSVSQKAEPATNIPKSTSSRQTSADISSTGSPSSTVQKTSTVSSTLMTSIGKSGQTNQTSTIKTITAIESTTAHSITSLSTTPKQCASSGNQQCSYNTTTGECFCVCSQYLIGNACEFGKNITNVISDKESVPKKHIRVLLSIAKPFTKDLKNSSSAEYRALENTLQDPLAIIYRNAAPEYYTGMKIYGFSNGSIIVNSTGIYLYPNNQAGIDFLNSHLESEVNSSFQNPQTLKSLSDQVNASTRVSGVNSDSSPITRVTQMKQYFNCSLTFAQYTVRCDNQSCFCTGPCYHNESYCNYRGDCYNTQNGPVCQCYSYNFYQYGGKQCDLYERSAGFYGVIFGVIGAVLLLVIVVIFAVIVIKKKKTFRKFAERRDSRRWFSLDEEFSHFSHTNMDNVATKSNTGKLSSRSGTYDLEGGLSKDSDFTPGVYRPTLENVDITKPIKIKRPELVPPYNEQR